MPNNIKVTIKMRTDYPSNWSSNNPILANGEFGLEHGTFLLKIGDGGTHWNSLPYLNKLNNNHFVQSADGTISFTNEFSALLTNALIAAQDANNGRTVDATTTPIRIDYGTDNFNRPNIPNNGDNLAIVNKYYVDRAIALAGHLKKQIITTNELEAFTNTPSNADPYTIYMVLDATQLGADKYKEYMIINDANNQPQMTQIGDTSVDLKNLVTGNTTAGHLIAVAADGSLVDAGVSAVDAGALEIATTSALGGVKSGTGDAGDDRIVVNSTTGFMTLAHVSTNLLYVPTGDTLILDGGTSNGGTSNGGAVSG